MKKIERIIIKILRSFKKNYLLLRHNTKRKLKNWKNKEKRLLLKIKKELRFSKKKLKKWKNLKKHLKNLHSANQPQVLINPKARKKLSLSALLIRIKNLQNKKRVQKKKK